MTDNKVILEYFTNELNNLITYDDITTNPEYKQLREQQDMLNIQIQTIVFENINNLNKKKFLLNEIIKIQPNNDIKIS
jgi:hypothetical protein